MKKWKQLKSKWWLRLICWFVCESHDLQVSSVYYFITNICTLINLLNRVWKIINNNWMRLSKIWFVYLPEASRSIIQLRQVVDLWDTDKSRYFAITEFNNYFIIQSLSLFFLMNILGKRSDLPFSCKSDRKKEKGTVSFMHEKNIICSQTLLEALHMSRPLFVGSYLQVTWWALGQMKRKKNLLRKII